MNYYQEFDEPIDEEIENIIDVVGSKTFLAQCIQQFKITLNIPVHELSETEARKVIRGIYRNAADYRGPKQ